MPETGSLLYKLLPVAPILVPLAVHFLLTNFVLLAVLYIDIPGFSGSDYVNWLPLTYLFSHFFFFIVGIWTAQDKEGLIPVISFIFIVIVTILDDIIILGMFFGRAQRQWGDGDSMFERTWQFSAGMMILNLIGKPLTIASSCLALYFRIPGASIPEFFGKLGGGGGGGGGGDNSGYQQVYGSTSPAPPSDNN